MSTVEDMHNIMAKTKIQLRYDLDNLRWQGEEKPEEETIMLNNMSLFVKWKT